MNKDDIKLEDQKPAKEERKEEPQPIDQPKNGWFFSNTGEGTPFGVEANTYEEAVEANRRHLEAEHKKEKH